MTFREWVDEQIKAGVFGGLKDACRTLAEETSQSGEKVSAVSIENAYQGMRFRLYRKGKALSDVTKGAVTVGELCE